MKQDQYKDVLENRILPQNKDWFPNGEPYIFMQNGAPNHTARLVKAFLQAKDIPLLPWLRNMPDKNAIENAWQLMKIEVAEDMITTKTEWIVEIIHVWSHYSELQKTV